MNKLFIVTLFAFLTLGQSFQHGRDFITSLFLHAQGINVQLGDCLGKYFDQETEKLSTYMRRRNYPLAILTYPILMNDIYQKCPMKNFAELYQFIERRFNDGSIARTLGDKMLKIFRVILDEYESPEHTGATIGRDVGKIVKILITKPKSSFYSFLEAQEVTEALDVPESNADPFVILQGLFKGLSNESTFCFESITNAKTTLMKIFEEVKQRFYAGEDFNQVLLEVGIKFIQIAGVIDYCRVLDLYTAFTNIMTPGGLNIIAEKLLKDTNLLIEAGTNLKQGLADKADYDIGYNAAVIAKSLFNLFVL